MKAEAWEAGANSMKKPPILLHPFLFALLPVVSLYSYNTLEIGPGYAFRSLIVVLAAAMALVLVLRTLFQDVHAGGLIASILLILFFAYGHIYYGLVPAAGQDLVQRSGLAGDHRILLVLSAIVLGLAVIVVLRVRRLWGSATRLLNWIALAALLAPGVRIVLDETSLRGPWPEPALPAVLEYRGQGRPPDIYYIILDGYARQDVLERVYGYDDRAFLDSLEAVGFVVSERARSNYGQTNLSLASSLNMEYLDFLSGVLAEDSADRRPLARLIHHSLVRRALEGLGYRTVAFATGYRMTEIPAADAFYRPPLGAANGFETLLMETSALVAGFDLAQGLGGARPYPGFEAHRRLVQYTLGTLPEIAASPGPKFVFVHLVGPHPPFVFGADGGPVTHSYHYSFRDGDAFPGTAAQYVQGYRDQVEYLSGEVLRVLAEILTRSEQPPVILLQADHGPGLGLNWASPEDSDLEERFGILSAYHLPGVAGPALDEALSPVNSFRVVFNAYFEAGLPLLPDRSYFALWERLYRFVEIEP